MVLSVYFPQPQSEPEYEYYEARMSRLVRNLYGTVALH